MINVHLLSGEKSTGAREISIMLYFTRGKTQNRNFNTQNRIQMYTIPEDDSQGQDN